MRLTCVGGVAEQSATPHWMSTYGWKSQPAEIKSIVR